MFTQFNLSRGGRGRVGGGGRPPSPFRPETCLRLKFLHRQARISLFNWLNFLNETAYRILPLN